MKELLQQAIEGEAKQKLLDRQNGDVVKVTADGKINQVINDHIVQYSVNWQFLRKSGNELYIEERHEERQAYYDEGQLQLGSLVSDEYKKNEQRDFPNFIEDFETRETRVPFYYNRQKAVQYAESWWNAYNPNYPKFNDDCTNYISQCLRAGGFPMEGFGQRNKGWWFRSANWSYSWAVAHALQLFLTASSRTKQVPKADLLQYGDIICYDFEGDGRFNHNTIVTGKDAYGQPLVNAHSTNSRQRYWAYEDSTAYTPKIRYKFFQIGN